MSALNGSRFRVVLLLLVLARPARAEDGRIEVVVEGLRSARGEVSCALFSEPAAFPTRLERAARRVSAAIREGTATCVFDGVASGSYAAAVFHDENGNGRLDTNWLGIPAEGLACSRDARGHFGPPSFADARFDHAAAGTRLVVHVRY